MAEGLTVPHSARRTPVVHIVLLDKDPCRTAISLVDPKSMPTPQSNDFYKSVGITIDYERGLWTSSHSEGETKFLKFGELYVADRRVIGILDFSKPDHRMALLDYMGAQLAKLT